MGLINDIKASADEDETAAPDDCIYGLDDKLLSGDNLLSERDNQGKVIVPAKYDYDESGIYVPYTVKYQAIGCMDYIDGVWYEDEDHKTKFHTADNIYLKIERIRETKKAILIKCTWVRKAADEYMPFNSFNIECTWGDILDTYAKFNKDGKVTSNKLNQKASMTGRDAMIPASKGSYVAFIDDMRRDILLSSCLEVFKNADYEWPEISDDDIEDAADIPVTFMDYPESIRNGAMQLINNNLLLDNIIDNVASIQYGNEDVKKSLILTLTTPYVLEPLHTLLDGKRGGGKTALIMEIVKNYPDGHIFHYQSFSAKNIFYDKDKFNPDGVNILILDDPNLNNDERVETLKILSDNEKPVKTLKTVINQKAVEFELTGKFLIIITYAKEIPDEELANRLHNTSLIIAENERIPIKYKIRDNAATDIKNNAAVMKIREYNKAAIHYLSERKMRIFNPFNLFINVDDFNNRDITDLISIILAESFFNYSNLKSITVNESIELVIGSYDEVEANLKSWDEDEYQSEKLSSRQKEIMDMLPAYTDNEAETKVKEVLDEIADYDSVNAKKRVIESKFYTINRIAKEMGLNSSTVNNALNRNHKQGSTTRSLAEMDLVHKIQIDSSHMQTHPNIFYKPITETEGASSDNDSNIYVAMDTAFTKQINTLEGKQSILINLLIYVNITLNKKGYTYLKKYCNNYVKRMATDDYDSYYNFIADFMNGLTDDHCIDIETASIDELRISAEEMKKINRYIPADISDKNTKLSNISEDALNENQTEDELCNDDMNSIHSSSFKNKATIEEMGYDFSIVQIISDILRYRYATPDDVLSKYEEFDIAPDGSDDDKVIQIVTDLKKMAADKLIKKSMMNGQTVYEITERQYDFINAKADDGK